MNIITISQYSYAKAIFILSFFSVCSMKMRTLNETFTEEEFEKLRSAKGDKTWHDFIMELVKK